MLEKLQRAIIYKAIKGKIMEEDNYQILDTERTDFDFLDKVILSTEYVVQDHNEAYQKSQIRINQVK